MMMMMMTLECLLQIQHPPNQPDAGQPEQILNWDLPTAGVRRDITERRTRNLKD
jgi:hypothetical protein